MLHLLSNRSSTSALDTSGYSSPSESTDELDKSYWIKRAGEVYSIIIIVIVVYC